MVTHPSHQRTGVTVSPLIFIGAIFIALCVIEGLLAARFWIQLAAVHASDGLRDWVMELTHPLVSPFAGARDQAQDSVASFEQGTLLAGMAYLMGAVVLIMASLLFSGVLSGQAALSMRSRRNALQQFQHPLVTPTGPRLIATVFVALNASQATRALRMLRMDQLKADLHVIPAERGSVIAAFERPGAEPSPWRAIQRTATGGEAACVRRALRALEQRFAVRTPVTSGR